jgi:hypothetical protein
MTNARNHDDPESLLKRKYDAPTPTDGFLRDLDARVREELEHRHRSSAASNTRSNSSTRLMTVARKAWPVSAGLAACVAMVIGVWLLCPTQDDNGQIVMVEPKTDGSTQPGDAETDGNGSQRLGRVKNKTKGVEAPHARCPHDTTSGAYAGVKRPASDVSSSGLAVEITTARRVSEASAIVRAQFIDFADTKQSRWEVKKVLHGEVAGEVVVSTHLMPPSRSRDLPEESANQELTYEELIEMNFSIPLQSPWTLEDDVILYLGECSDVDVDNEVHCDFTSVQYQNDGCDLDEVEVDIQRVIESGEHLKSEPGDEPGPSRTHRLNAATQRG